MFVELEYFLEEHGAHARLLPISPVYILQPPSRVVITVVMRLSTDRVIANLVPMATLVIISFSFNAHFQQHDYFLLLQRLHQPKGAQINVRPETVPHGGLCALKPDCPAYCWPPYGRLQHQVIIGATISVPCSLNS